MECLKDNVSGHILKYVNPYIFFKTSPKNNQNTDLEDIANTNFELDMKS